MKSNYKNNQSSAGFTLIELLVAASITTIVVSLAGSGLVSIMQNNSKAEAETLRRVQLNRALDFMSDEVRTAKTIAKDASANLATVAPGFNPLNKTPVLTLEIPGVSQRVIYYTGTPSTTSVWFDPKAPDAKMIYRWGPIFGDDGQYTNTSKNNDPPVGCSNFTACNPRSWDGNALVDLIADTTLASPTTCPGLTGWTANPSVNNGQGFTACVDPTGKIAKINLRGKLTDAYNNSRPPFEVSTKTFSRLYTPTFTTGSGGGSGLGSGGSTGTVTFTQPSTAYFEVLGGEITCGAGGSKITTTTTINTTAPGATTSTPNTVPALPLNQALNLSALAGTKLTVTGSINSCGVNNAFNSETHKNTQVWTLRNGDTPPPFAPFGTQPKIDVFLTKYLDANGKVKLAENQVIYLFELGTTVKTSAAYDMQDLVVLATITPKTQ